MAAKIEAPKAEKVEKKVEKKTTTKKVKENFPGFIQHIFQPSFIGL